MVNCKARTPLRLTEVARDPSNYDPGCVLRTLSKKKEENLDSKTLKRPFPPPLLPRFVINEILKTPQSRKDQKKKQAIKQNMSREKKEKRGRRNDSRSQKKNTIKGGTPLEEKVCFQKNRYINKGLFFSWICKAMVK